jgi:hypothetical protein
MNNPAFKSLSVEFANPTCLRALASILRKFDTLTEFTLHDCEEHDEDDEYDFSVALRINHLTSYG